MDGTSPLSAAALLGVHAGAHVRLAPRGPRAENDRGARDSHASPVFETVPGALSSWFAAWGSGSGSETSQELEAEPAKLSNLGGATAMYHADIPIEDIQRRGRWKSDCWRIYIFGDRNRARGLLDAMTASCVELFRRR